jgi:predicted N-acetyltransferase YhbS
MDYETGVCRADELVALADLANRVFRGRRPGDMASEYPLVFDPGRLENMRIARLGSELVSHVGVCIRDAEILGARIRVASIGAVCTDPEHRGHGLASRLMDDALAYSKAERASLMLISGGRGLYHRLGYVQVGAFQAYSADAGDADAGVAVAELEPGDLSAVIHLHQAEPVRFLRPREDWDKLLAAGMLMNQKGDLLVVRSQGRIAAYVAVQRPAPDPSGAPVRARVKEFGGSRSCIASALPAIASRYGAATVELVTGEWDIEWQVQAVARGWAPSQIPFPGTLGIIEPERFLRAVSPLLAERSAAVEIAAQGEGALLRSGSEQLEFRTVGELTAFVFGGNTEEALSAPRPSEALTRRLAGLFPLPLLWYGYNYV